MNFTGGRAVEIVGFDVKKSRATLDDRRLSEIIRSRPEIGDMPTIVIAIGGVARSGKSFLLNLFVNYLTFLEQNGHDNGWENSSSVVEGVNWAQSRTAVTLGIWMWNKPFIVTRSDGSRAAVLLVDSQGTGDNRHSDVKLDTLIMYISLQISSVQVLNIEKYLTSHEMISLQLCADYADVGRPEDSSGLEDNFLFKSLMFVIRDYQSGDNYGEDLNLFPEIIRENANDALHKVVLGIRNAFRTITSYNMPHPGMEIAKASAKSRSWRVQDVPGDFLTTAKQLIRQLCSLERSQRPQDCWPSALELEANFKMLKYHLENDDLPSITNPAEALQETILYRAYSTTQKEFTQAIAKLSDAERLKTFNTEADLKRAFDQETANAFTKFQKAGRSHKYSSSPIWRKYEGMLDTAFETTYSGLKIQYDFHKQIKRLEKENVVVREKMDQQADEFQKEIGSLSTEISETRLKQAESEDLFRAKEASMQTEIENLQQAVEEAQNDEEKERLREMIFNYQQETSEMREENERAKREHSRQLEALTSKMDDMQASHQRGLDMQNEATEQLRRQLEEERERSRRQEEEYRNASNKADPLSVFYQTLSGAFLGALTGGPAGAFMGALGGLGGAKSDKKAIAPKAGEKF